MERSILIVEDEFIVANDLAFFLEEQKFVVLGIAATVNEARALIDKQRPYIVLLDIHLKGKLTGIDLAKKLQQMNIPFIYLSAYSNKFILEQAKKTNPYGFLVKPFREKDLRIALEIAAYRIEHSVDINKQQEKQLHENLDDIPVCDNSEELLEEIAKVLQPVLSYDLLFFNFTKALDNLKLGIHRVGIHDYRRLGVNEMATILGLSAGQVEKIIKQQNQQDEGIYQDKELDKLQSKASFAAFVSKAFQMESMMSLTISLGNDQKLNLSFFAKETGVFNANKIELIQRLNTSFSHILESKIQQETKTGSTSHKNQSKGDKKKDITKGIIGTSPKLLEVLQNIKSVAPMKTSVLIMGESGTGKELFAKCIHELSPRSSSPFVPVNCGAIPENLIESILFGHTKGAFTGAISNQEGKFEQANGGTIFLDEIGEMSLEMQVRLLRVLQENEIERIGDNRTIPIDVRIIAATNKNLEQEIEAGNFRLDLYYRLHVFPLYAPTLRERKEDIPELAHYFLRKYAKKAGKPIKNLSNQTQEALLQYDYPGNIRELENIIERAVVVEDGKTLTYGSWMPQKEFTISDSKFKTFESKQKDYIVEVLNHTNWRVSGPKGAAKILGMNEKTLFAKIKRLGIEKQVGQKS